LVISGFKLRESNSVEHVVDEFGSFVKGGDLDGLFIIFIGPFFVSGFSFSRTFCDGIIDFFVILFGLR
jgi:hypothetical protein